MTDNMEVPYDPFTIKAQLVQLEEHFKKQDYKLESEKLRDWLYDYFRIKS